MSFKFLARRGAWRWAWIAALAGSALLASCGGGQITLFHPTRVLAFGDEMSTLEPDGRKYSINGFKQITAPDGTVTDDPTTLDCTRNPTWVQIVATSFGLAFDRCLGTATGASGQVLAQVGHKVADFAAQVAAVQGNVLGEADLALVMFGQNDILELYGQYPTLSAAVLLAQAQVRGTALGQQINQLALRGPAVVVVTTPDIGLSPFAAAQNISTGDPTRSALLSALVEKFNNSMSVALINDGHLIGLAYGDLEMQNNFKFPTVYGLLNVDTPACLDTAPLPACTTATLTTAAITGTAATATTWLWADSTRPSPFFQSRLGLLAGGRAHSNPF